MNFLKKKTKISYYTILSISIWMIISIMFIGWHIAGKAVVEYWDGQSQHFVSFVYFGEYMRGLLKSFFFDHNFNLPLYDFSIGYGQDIIGTLHYYIIGDPLGILAIFAKPQNAESVFAFAIMLRLFLAGITFSIFVLKKNASYFQSYVGTLVYVFSGYAISASTRHPYFINAMIYLPLLCLGIDYILEKKGHKLFIFMVFVSVVSNFYFFYMLTLLSFIYAVYRYLDLYSIKDTKQLLSLLGQSIVSYIVGVFMGACVFIPVVFQFLNAGRGTIRPTINLFYTKDFYLSFVKNFISPVYGGGAWTITAYLPIVVLAFACLFYRFSKKDRDSIKDLFALFLLTIFLLIPYIGSFFNGFSYSANRWIFGYSFYLACITTKYLPNATTLVKSVNDRQKVLRISIFVLLAAFVFSIFNFNRSVQPLLGIIFLLLYLVIMLLPVTIKQTKILFSLLTLTNVFIYVAFQTNTKINPNLYNSYTKANIVQNDYWAFKSSVVKDIQKKDDDWFRYELSNEDYRAELNNSLIRHTNSTNFYFSLANGNVFSFNKNVENNIHSDFEYYGLDNRAELSTLANGKYYLKESITNNKLIPYGYKHLEDVKKGNKTIQVYENTNFLPFGYTYNSYIKPVSYSTSALEKMESMLHGVIVDKKIPGLKSLEPEKSNIQKLNYEIISKKDVEITRNRFTVLKPGGEVTFKIDSDQLENTSNYLFVNLKNIDFPSNQNNLYGLRALKDETSLQVTYDTLSKDFVYRNQYQGWYVGIKNALLDLGPITNSNEVKLKFKNPGNYTFGSIDFNSRSYDHLGTKINQLKQNTLENTKFNTNNITGNITLERKKLLLLGIPYAKGWSAYDNGKKIPIVQSNYMYSGLVLGKGNHKIVLKYMTPGLKIGILFSILGWVVFIVLIIKKRKNPSNDGGKNVI